jgi:hypothetical protein
VARKLGAAGTHGVLIVRGSIRNIAWGVAQGPARYGQALAPQLR